MKKQLLFFIAICLYFISCTTEVQVNSVEKWKREIVETEQNFANMAKQDGIQAAFLAYASEDAVLLRNDKLVIGKPAIQLHFENRKANDTTTSLSWKPDFVDVATSGDLGYTYGRYIYSFADSSGQIQQLEGVFHTVWKRQADKNWKFVWD